jgi:ribose 1,5-bisphosphokinase PhnN
MNLVVFVGPPASGKDYLIEILLKILKKYRGQFKRGLYYSTRQKRLTDIPGQNILLISRKKFLSLRKQIVSQDISNNDLVGYSLKELRKAEYVIISASRKNLPELNRLVKVSNGKMFSLYLSVPKSVRKKRLEKRLDSLDPDYIKNKLKYGVAHVSPSRRLVFTKVYRNPDGKAEEVVGKIMLDLEKHFNLRKK